MGTEEIEDEGEKLKLIQAAQARDDGWYLYETNITLDGNGVYMFKVYKHPKYPWTRTNHYDANKSKELFDEMRLSQEWL